MSQPEEVAAAAVVYGGHTSELAAFRAAVESNGVRWLDAPEGFGPLVVFVTDVAEVPPALSGDREILPVMFVDGFPEAFRGMSKLRPQDVGAEAAARLLAETIKSGPSTLVVWQRLVDEARDWHAGGGAAHLLAEDQQVAAFAALASEHAGASADIDLVRGFVVASSRHSRGVRRRTTAVLATVAIALVGAITLAVVQTVTAVSEFNRSATEANAAEAGRLADLALDYLDRDPDLPEMLAGTAEGLSLTPTVREAVGQVTSAQVAHTSFGVDGVPYWVTTSASGRIAVTVFDDAVIRVYEADGRQIAAIHTQPEAEEPRTGGTLLSPDGTQLAFDDGTLRIFDLSGNERVVPDWTGDDTIELWWDSDHLLVDRDGTADLLDIDSGRSEPLAGEGLGQIRVAKPSLDRSVLALSDTEKVQVWDLKNDRVLQEADVPNVTDVAVSDDGNYLIGAAFPHAQIIEFENGTPTVTSAEDDWATIGVESLGDGYFAASDRVGTIALYSRDNIGTQSLVRFRAHLSDNVRIATTTNGDLVSVGFDRMVRVWSTSELVRLGAVTPAGIVTDESSVAADVAGGRGLESFPAVTLRNQVRMGPTGLANVILTHTSTAGAVDPADATHAEGALFGGTFNRMFLSQDGRFLVVAVGIDDTALELWPLNAAGDDWDAATLTIAVDLPTGPAGATIGPILPAVSPDGTAVALLDSTSLRVWDGQGAELSSVEFVATADPLAVTVAADRTAQAITADGVLHRTDGDDIELLGLWSSAPSDVTLAAAEFDQDGAVLLSTSGALARFDGSDVRQLLPPGTLGGNGTLRLSDDGATVVSIAPDAVTIVRESQVVARLATRVGIPVADAAITTDGTQLVTISSIGTVASFRLGDLGVEPLISSPRDYTPTERLVFELGGNGG